MRFLLFPGGRDGTAARTLSAAGLALLCFCPAAAGPEGAAELSVAIALEGERDLEGTTVEVWVPDVDSGTRVFTGSTGRDGTLEIPGLPAGKYQLLIWRAGFETVVTKKGELREGANPVQSIILARDVFSASFYFGDAISSFAASEYRRLQNPEDTNDVRHGFVAGVDLESSLRMRHGKRFTFYGETVYGVRNLEVNCGDQPDSKPCQTSGSSSQDALYVIRNATSFEAYAGFKADLATIHRGSPLWEGRVYVKAQGGFMAVAGSGGDFIDNHFAGVGAELLAGDFAGSYFDVGWGRSDVYQIHPYDRLKVDGFLTWKLSRRSDYPRGFIQFYVDTDVGQGSDTFVTYIGLDFDVRDMLKGRKGSRKE